MLTLMSATCIPFYLNVIDHFNVIDYIRPTLFFSRSWYDM